MEAYISDLRGEFPHYSIYYEHTGKSSVDYSGEIIIDYGSREVIWKVLNPDEDWNIKFTYDGSSVILQSEYKDDLEPTLRKMILLHAHEDVSGLRDDIQRMDNEIFYLRADLRSALTRIKDLEEALLYAPGGPMYESAKADFENRL